MALVAEDFPGGWNEEVLSPHDIEIGDHVIAETRSYYPPEDGSTNRHGSEIERKLKIISGMVTKIIDKEHADGGYFFLESTEPRDVPHIVTTKPILTADYVGRLTKITKTLLFRKPLEA